MVSWLVKQGNYIVKCSVVPSVNLISPAFVVQMFGFSVNRRAIKTAIFCHFSHVLPFAQIAHPVFVHFARNPHPVRMACQTLHNAPQARAALRLCSRPACVRSCFCVASHGLTRLYIDRGGQQHRSTINARIATLLLNCVNQ